MTVFREWLIADERGAFAMGTPEGVRRRKYHGFYQTIAGRSESAFFADMELVWNDRPLWPHVYASSEGTVLHPDPRSTSLGAPPKFSLDPHPEWTWKVEGGSLSFVIQPRPSGGFQMTWSWKFRRTARKSHARASKLRIRPLLAMRNLHATGGVDWKTTQDQHSCLRIESGTGLKFFILPSSHLEWRPSPDWYRSFHYSEEQVRGYDAQEDLFSAGEFEVSPAGETGSCSLEFSERIEDLHKKAITSRSVEKLPDHRSPVMDYVLHEPAGIVAGYPWFGEWGRDTFISLPGIVAARLASGESPPVVEKWAYEVIDRWAEWIERVGMVPNLIEKEGSHQWQSADGTLWWCHALAALWQISLDSSRPIFRELEQRFSQSLNEVILAIEQGRHLFLRHDPADGLLEVTEAHATWMDAQLEGRAVSPRMGKLPEINALWFQANCLRALWREGEGSADASESTRVANLGMRALTTGATGNESKRPNRIFLHSLPLAPSFVLGRAEESTLDLMSITERLWTPVGLRTLDPSSPGYRARLQGTQAERDEAYHQGTVWGWLGGHHEMARHRLSVSAKGRGERAGALFPSHLLKSFPIQGHIPEVFDSEEPHTPRGAPAQAWSLACREEAIYRKSRKLDSRLRDRLGTRWLDAASRARAAVTGRRAG